VASGFASFQEKTGLLGDLEGRGIVLRCLLPLLPPLIDNAKIEVRFTHASARLQRFLQRQGLLLIGMGFLVCSAIVSAIERSATLDSRNQSRKVVRLPEQTLRSSERMLILDACGDLLGLFERRKEKNSVSLVEKVIFGEDLSIE
jgi:hypothetical protein